MSVCLFQDRIGWESVLFAERPLQQPANNREVATLIVRRQNNGILVLCGAHLANSNYFFNKAKPTEILMEKQGWKLMIRGDRC